MTAHYQSIKQVTVVSLSINTVLGIVKTLLGYLGHSHAVFADGLHSFSDLLSDLLVLFAAKFGMQRADHNHPYGHRRIETVATVAVSLLVLLTGLGILIDATDELIKGTSLLKPHTYMLWVAFFSVLANEALYRYTAWVGRRIDSQLLLANAWHSRSDALSSLVVLVGVLGALLGIVWLDNAAAIIVGVIVMKMGWSLGFSGVRELVDTGVDQDKLVAIEKTIKRVSGVQAVHCLRTRSMAGDIYVDVHVLVAPDLTVSEGHYISDAVHQALISTFEKIIDVTVHIDPEEDLDADLYPNLPDRATLVPKLNALWQSLPGYEQIAQLQLHYFAGQIEIALFLTIESKPPWLNNLLLLQTQYQQAIQGMTDIRSVSLWVGSKQI